MEIKCYVWKQFDIESEAVHTQIPKMIYENKFEIQFIPPKAKLFAHICRIIT